MTNAYFWLFGALAFALILAGHILRSYKFKRLLDPVKDSGTRTQFQSSSLVIFSTPCYPCASAKSSAP
jgi:hypothetical protein